MEKLVEVKNVSKSFDKKDVFGNVVSSVKANTNISLDIYENETLGLVGESGSGKSTLGKLILGFESPSSGDISYNKIDINSPKTRKNDIQIIFQDTFSSLNPHMNILDIVAEPLKLDYPAKEAYQRAKTILDNVSIKEDSFKKKPRAFSGGQRQRINIARAIATNPKLIVCDEPVSALDVSIQASIINLLMDIQKENKLSYLFISHDLTIVRNVSDRIAVMYKGHLVELGETEAIFANPLHDYTKKLLAASPLTKMSYEDSQEEISLGQSWTELEKNHFVLV